MKFKYILKAVGVTGGVLLVAVVASNYHWVAYTVIGVGIISLILAIAILFKINDE